MKVQVLVASPTQLQLPADEGEELRSWFMRKHEGRHCGIWHRKSGAKAH